MLTKEYLDLLRPLAPKGLSGNDAVALINAIDARDRDINSLVYALDKARADRDRAETERDQARAEITRLRAVLEDLLEFAERVHKNPQYRGNIHWPAVAPLERKLQETRAALEGEK